MDYEGGCDEHLDEGSCTYNDKNVALSPRIVVLNSDQGGDGRQDSETNLEAGEGLYFSDTESSFSSNSSFDDFIPITSQIFLQSRGEKNTPQPNGSTKPSYGNGSCTITSEDIYRLEESVNSSPDSTSRSSDVALESSMEHALPTLSPSIQVIERPEGFDHNAICTSHTSRPSTAGEASAASDDCSRVSMNNQVDMNVGYCGDSTRAKRQPDEVETSAPHIASRIKKNPPCSFRHCPDCCQAFRCFNPPSHCSSRWTRWPDCSFKWFCQPSCFGNCLSWLGCCCKRPSRHCKYPLWSSCCPKCKC